MIWLLAFICVLICDLFFLYYLLHMQYAINISYCIMLLCWHMTSLCCIQLLKINTLFFFHSQKWYKTDIIYFQFIHHYWDPVGHIALWYTVWCPHGCILCNCSRSSKYSMPRENLHTVKRPQKWSINIPSVSLFPLLPPPRTVAHYYCTVLTALQSDFKSHW